MEYDDVMGHVATMRHKATIQGELRAFWDLEEMRKDEHDAIRRKEFVLINMKLQRVLSRDTTKEQAEAGALEDWVRDSKGLHSLSFEQFVQSMCEMVSLWAGVDLSEEAYCRLLRNLLFIVSAPHTTAMDPSQEQRRFRADSDIPHLSSEDVLHGNFEMPAVPPAVLQDAVSKPRRASISHPPRPKKKGWADVRRSSISGLDWGRLSTVADQVQIKTWPVKQPSLVPLAAKGIVVTLERGEGLKVRRNSLPPPAMSSQRKSSTGAEDVARTTTWFGKVRSSHSFVSSVGGLQGETDQRALQPAAVFGAQLLQEVKGPPASGLPPLKIRNQRRYSTPF